ncbi:DUF5053 domain-containing protein [Parabacteroides sp. Marseille-P3160]|uniref:DUF5053 domain-containing protein n=1 Tax=Parabacteroides sp. Marseille-P3160 TaxID=1917887 RepID=UPI0009B9F9A9|nr:DUF5053 domain-containing protein [Parabacteroides sp. Marseille-P3160]
MDKKIQELKERFRVAKTDKELEEIDKEIDSLSSNNKVEFAGKMLDSIQETNKELEEAILREKLKDILPAISVSHLAKEYFQKSPQWFYQRLNGNIVNNKKASFTREELGILAHALTDISDKIKQSVALVV